MKHLAREMSILGAFITCMYFGFVFGSAFAFIGAIIAFFCLGEKHND